MTPSPPPAEPMAVESQEATQVSATEGPNSTRTSDGQGQEAQQAATIPQELERFKWREGVLKTNWPRRQLKIILANPEYEDDLRDMALNGKMVPEWPILSNIIKSRLVYNTHAFLVKTPRVKYRPLPNPTTQRNALLPATSIDSFAIDDVPSEVLRPTIQRESQETPSTPGGLIIPPFPPRTTSRRQSTVGSHRRTQDSVEIDDEAMIGGRTLKSEMEPTEAWTFLKGLFKLLDEFETAPPFTIQRLCELAWKPFLQHSSVGKYLRAIEKNLLVTSTYGNNEQDGENGDHPTSGGFSAMNGTMGLRSRASSISSSSSTSSLNVPLFSPIPFLVERRIINPDGTPVSTPATLPGASGSETDVPTSSLSLNLNISARTGEDVPMNGTEERPGTPMHGVSQESMQQGGHGKADQEPLNHLALSTSAVSVLAQNGNGTNGHETRNAANASTDTAHEPFTGRVDELDAGPLQHTTTQASPSDPHQLHLPPTSSPGTHHQEGTGERGTMTPHGMSDRPQAISSTTDLNAVVPHAIREGTEMDPPVDKDGARVIRGLPRTSSSVSLGDRFVSGEILEANIPREEESKPESS